MVLLSGIAKLGYPWSGWRAPGPRPWFLLCVVPFVLKLSGPNACRAGHARIRQATLRTRSERIFSGDNAANWNYAAWYRFLLGDGLNPLDKHRRGAGALAAITASHGLPSPARCRREERRFPPLSDTAPGRKCNRPNFLRSVHSNDVIRRRHSASPDPFLPVARLQHYLADSLGGRGSGSAGQFRESRDILHHHFTVPARFAAGILPPRRFLRSSAARAVPY